MTAPGCAVGAVIKKDCQALLPRRPGCGNTGNEKCT